jgi:hypothetical protein
LTSAATIVESGAKWRTAVTEQKRKGTTKEKGLVNEKILAEDNYVSICQRWFPSIDLEALQKPNRKTSDLLMKLKQTADAHRWSRNFRWINSSIETPWLSEVNPCRTDCTLQFGK